MHTIHLAIEWYPTVEELGIPESDIVFIQEWVVKNADELHEIYHFVQDHEMEGSKIIDGRQLTAPDGKIEIISYELHLLNNISLLSTARRPR